MNTTNIDTLGTKLATDAMTLLVRLCPAELKAASHETVEAACAAMRTRARPELDEFLDAARDCPALVHVAYQSAALGIAQAGIDVLKHA